MRGLRFIVLLLIAIPLGWYAYYDSKKGPVDDSPKRDKVFTVDADKISANYEHGILRISIPKSERARPREIPGSAASGAAQVRTGNLCEGSKPRISQRKTEPEEEVSGCGRMN